MLSGERPSEFTSPGVEQRPRPSGRARTRARARRWLARALTLVPGSLVIALDVSLRPGTLTGAGAELAYVRAAVLGILLWGTLGIAAASRRGAFRWLARAMLGLLALTAIGGQLYAFARYRAFPNTSSMLVGTAMLPSIREQVWVDHASFFRAVLPPLLGLAALVFVQRRLAPPRRWARRAAGDAFVALLGVVLFFGTRVEEREVAPFDTLYIHGVGQLARAVWDENPVLARAYPGPRSPRPLPTLHATPARPRNVLLVLTESVRAQSACVAYDPDCRYTPFSNAAAKQRIPLEQMRSVDSTTAISLGVLWSGIAPYSTREELHAAPLVWEYAIAAGLDTAYWTSQNLLFGNSGAWLDGIPWGHHVSATGLDPDASLETGADDALLVEHVDAELASLREPFFAVVHLSNTHMPYAIDDTDAPFQPQGASTGAGHETEVTNRYLDAVYHQDRAIGRLLEAVRAEPSGARTVVVFLSDHGEQLYEKGAFGHTGTLFEPEIRIPAWVDAPPGTLSVEEEANLRALRVTPLTTMDVLPTLLDLMGVADDPGVLPIARDLPGRSLLRGGSAVDTIVGLTNCSPLWNCVFKNWGALRGTHKLVGLEGDPAWSCYDIEADPFEHQDLGPAACGPLREFAESSMHGRPF